MLSQDKWLNAVRSGPRVPWPFDLSSCIISSPHSLVVCVYVHSRYMLQAESSHELLCETIIGEMRFSVVLLTCFFKCGCEERDAHQQWPVVLKEPVVPKIAERASTWVTLLRRTKGLLTFLLLWQDKSFLIEPESFCVLCQWLPSAKPRDLASSLCTSYTL